jgi:hypothetical protein
MIVTRGDAGVRREHRARRSQFERARKIETLAHELADPLEHEERRVAFVDVPDGGLEAQGLQSSHAPDSQQDLLLDSRVSVAPIEPVRDLAILVAVFLQVGIEKVKDHAADARPPELELHPSSRKIHHDAHLAAFRPQHGQNRQVAERRVGIDRVLPAFQVDALLKISLAIEKADRDERQALVARRLAVVAGKNAQAPRVDRQPLVKAELSAEVGDQVAVAERECLVRGGRCAIRVKGRKHAVEIVEKRRIARRVDEPPLVHASQERFGAVPDGFPERAVHAREKRARRAMPAMPKIIGELFKTS